MNEERVKKERGEGRGTGLMSERDQSKGEVEGGKREGKECEQPANFFFFFGGGGGDISTY